MPDVYIAIALVGLALVLTALGYALSTIRDHERRLAALEAQAANKHGALARERHDIGEASLFDLARLREEVEVLTNWIEYASRRAAHVAGGGKPDDPPTKWKKSP